MRILFITNMYPSAEKPVFGIFVQEQIAAVTARLRCQYDIYYIRSAVKGNLMYFVSLFRIPWKILTGKYDIVHIHYGLSALFLLLYKPRAKVFLTLHGADILPGQKRKLQVFLTRHLLRKVDRVFILNAEMEEIVRPLTPNYALLPCGVDTDFFSPGERVPANREKLVLFPGDPAVEVKNFPLFMETIDRLKRVTDHPVTYRTITGLSREEVKDLLIRADCMLMTSVSEGSPQVIKEALGCGLPVVSVNVGDVQQMTGGVPFCFISGSYDAGELSVLVMRAFNGRGICVRNAFLDKKTYGQDAVSHRLIGYYKTVVKPAETPTAPAPKEYDLTP